MLACARPDCNSDGIIIIIIIIIIFFLIVLLGQSHMANQRLTFVKINLNG